MTFANVTRPPRQPADTWSPPPIITVAPGELTCLNCGETTSDAYCYRCADAKISVGRGTPKPSDANRLIPTIDYLYPEEYRSP